MKFLKDYQELDFDIQIIATELDTSVNRLCYVSRKELEDGISIENFDKLFEEIAEGGEITSFTNEISLYEYLCEPIILVSRIDEKMVVFDRTMQKKIERKILKVED